MYSPLHASAGLLLATLAPNPVVAFGLGVLSHYVLDAIPHGDMNGPAWIFGGRKVPHLVYIEIADLGLAAAAVFILTAQFAPSVMPKLWLGALGGITPDLLWGTEYMMQRFHWRVPGFSAILHWHSRWHAFVHARKKIDVPYLVGLGYQGLLLVLLLG
ncbi:MAG: hypothetical protein HY092_00680, partial [Candidatus Kerfeldbacteria bacterium]|nr:hypothetical protein [Candidatus Kerfeldbacteria bacterium]